MAKCEYCGKEYESKRADSKYCSPKCRVTANRLSVTDVTDNKRNTDSLVTDNTGYEIVPDQSVYGRPAVRYKGDKFDIRPMPYQSDDQPDRDNRCIYTDQHGRYIVDATGHRLYKGVDWQSATEEPHPIGAWSC